MAKTRADPDESRISLDLTDGILIRGNKRVPLRPKTLAVLKALMDRRGGVVAQDDLRSAVWGTRFGNEGGPRQCVRELRRLLGDSASEPRYIETVGRSGYRLLVTIDLVGVDAPLSGGAICVGRERELAVLAAHVGVLGREQRSIALIAGEAGAGKTRLVDAFLATLPHAGGIWIGRGQCQPHAQAREPFGPLIDILGALAAGPVAPKLRPLLREYASSWVAQIPRLDDTSALVQRAAGSTSPPPERMVREFSDLMERLTRDLPGILVLEDLHWADSSTLAWLTAWSWRQGPARLLVIGSYRSDETEEGNGLDAALRALARQRDFVNLPLAGLDAAAVSDYLAQRFAGHRFPETLATALAERTEGHAILVDAVVEQWSGTDIQLIEGMWTLRRSVAQLVAGIVPGVRSLIAAQIEALSPADRQLLEAASVAGARFSAAALARDRADLERIERRLEVLARRRRFIENAGTIHWPDGTAAATYAFRHALYREALYELIPPANRQGLHQRIGRRLEAGFGPRAVEIAPLLADHFERAGDWRRATIHRTRSGGAALARGAAREAAAQFRQALELRRRAGDDVALSDAALDAQLGLGAALIVSEGFTAPDLPAVYGRARELARDLPEPGRSVPAIAGLWNYRISRADMSAARELADDLCGRVVDAAVPLRMAAYNAAGLTNFFIGAPRECLPYIKRVLDLHRSGPHDGSAAALFGEDPLVVCRQYAACVHQILGSSEEADVHFDTGRTLAESLDQPFARAQMLWSGAVIAQVRGDADAALRRAGNLIELCRKDHIPYWIPAGNIMAGWAANALGDPAGLAQLREGIDAYAAMEVRLTRPYSLGLLAEAAALRGDVQEGQCTLATALSIARTTGERWYEPELHRIWAELSVLIGRTDRATRALRRAQTLARAQGATLFENRTAARLVDLCQELGTAT